MISGWAEALHTHTHTEHTHHILIFLLFPVLQCPGSARRRRSATLLQRKAQLGESCFYSRCHHSKLEKQLNNAEFVQSFIGPGDSGRCFLRPLPVAAVSHYKEKLLRRCCQDGLRDVPMPYSCTRRSFYITESWECIHAFRYCCAKYKGEEFNTEMPTTTTTTSAPTTTVRPSVSSRSFGAEGIMPYGRIELAREMFGEFSLILTSGSASNFSAKSFICVFRSLLFLPDGTGAATRC